MLCGGDSHGDHVHSGNELTFAAPLLAGDSACDDVDAAFSLQWR
jgi:hypothetical protein